MNQMEPPIHYERYGTELRSIFKMDFYEALFAFEQFGPNFLSFYEKDLLRSMNLQTYGQKSTIGINNSSMRGEALRE